jgi:hypothetical protein
LDAEKVGANVTDLLAQINVAEGILLKQKTCTELETPTQPQPKPTHPLLEATLPSNTKTQTKLKLFSTGTKQPLSTQTARHKQKA